MATSRSKTKQKAKEFDIESVPFVDGPKITNEELTCIALALLKLTKSDSTLGNTATRSEQQQFDQWKTVANLESIDKFKI